MEKDRKQLAQREAAKVQLRKVYSLSKALLRSDAAYEAFQHEWSALQQQGTKRAREMSLMQMSGLEQVENNAVTRALGLLDLHLGALQAVVEKLGEWKLINSEVDELLKNPFSQLLVDYRNVIFHADRYDVKRNMNMLDNPEILTWTPQLAEAIRRSLRSLIANPYSTPRPRGARKSKTNLTR